MRVLLHYHQWDNRWIPYFERELSQYELTSTSTLDGKELSRLSKENDVLICMWADAIPMFWADFMPDKKKIVFMRRYELYTPFAINIKWPQVDALVFVSAYIQREFAKLNTLQPKRQYVIPNCIDLDMFQFKQGPTGKKIAYVCDIKESKNLSLAVQVLLHLPQGYTIHHVGKQSSQLNNQILPYLVNLGLNHRFITQPRIPASEIPRWLSDKDYILSTSFTEGNPNNVLEGMAVGLKPVVHNWPGAKDQFKVEYVFNTPEEAARIITDDEYDPKAYRRYVEDRYSLNNIKRIHNVIKDIMDE